jgi:hypothetical protein
MFKTYLPLLLAAVVGGIVSQAIGIVITPKQEVQPQVIYSNHEESSYKVQVHYFDLHDFKDSMSVDKTLDADGFNGWIPCATYLDLQGNLNVIERKAL